MSTILLNLDAHQGTRTHDFSVTYSRPIDISDGIYQVALQKLNLWYSFYNIAEQYNNNTFKYYDGTTWKDVIITDGQYSINQLNDALHRIMDANGDSTTDPVTGQPLYDVKIVPNFSTLRVRIEVSNSYEVDLTVSDLNDLLGFDKIIVDSTQEGSKVANINRGINTLQLHCDIISSSYQNEITTDLLYSFVPNTPPGSNIEIAPRHEIYLPIRIPYQIRNIRIYITDQLQRPVDLNGEPVSVLLSIKKIQ